MQRFVPLFFFTATILIVGGCGSSHDADKSWLYPVVDTTTQAHKTTFETKTDTVTTVGSKQQIEVSTPYNSAPVRFMVQIGSFKEIQFAGAVQTLARERYQLPVVNEYDTARRRYQIRIGFFETEPDAREFLLKLRTDYPQEYKDAWVIQLNK